MEDEFASILVQHRTKIIIKKIENRLKFTFGFKLSFYKDLVGDIRRNETPRWRPSGRWQLNLPNSWILESQSANETNQMV